MLAGCSSSTLLSPRHRLRSEASAQFQACHFQLPSMSTQRLDLPCNTTFPRRDTSSRSQPLRPVGLSLEKPIESKTSSTSCSLKHNIRLPPLAIKDNSLKRLPEHDDSFTNIAKRKKGNTNECDHLWFQPAVESTLGGLNSTSLAFSSQKEKEKEMVCFAPSKVDALSHSAAPLPLMTPWLESCVTKITNFGEGSHRPRHHNDHPRDGSVSNASSESQSLRLNDNVTEHEVGNGSGNPQHHRHHHHQVETGEEEDHHGFELLSLLTGCVDAIGSRNVTAINHFIAKLGDLASPKGSSISRLCAYFTEALAIRVTRLWPHVFHITTTSRDMVDEDETATALRLLNQVTPIPKFLHFTSNEMLLRAFEGKDRVHIIDFDIKQGLQWPSLFQSLASRTNPPSHVRITGIGESKQELNETGDRLAGYAEALNLPFDFHPVVDRLEDVRLWMLHVKEHETVAVNCVLQLHKTLYDGSGGALRDFLGLIRSTNPSIVVMAEQEAQHNETRLEARVCNSLKYYSALFDCIDESGLPQESAVRGKIEEMYAKEIRNIVACEGRDRLERHESFGNWRRMMVEQGGFRSVGVTDREMSQSQLLLKMYSCESYSVKKQDKLGATAVTLSWLDQPLYTVSAWVPFDVAGTSSSFSMPS